MSRFRRYFLRNGGRFLSVTWFLVVALAVGLGSTSCVKGGHAQSAPKSQDELLTDGERAYLLGDPIRAVFLLEKVKSSHPGYSYAQELIAQARLEADNVAQEWLRQIDDLVSRGRYAHAKKRIDHVLDFFPLSDARRTQAQRRRAEVDQTLEEQREALEELDAQAEKHLVKQEVDKALKLLEQAHTLAREVEPESLVARERVLAGTHYRLGQSGTKKKSVSASKKKRKRDSRKVKGAAASVEKKVSALTSERDKILELYELAQGFEARGAHYNAIVTYISIQEQDDVDPSVLAKVEARLHALRSKRAELVEKFLAQANEHFLRQDLVGAMPYYMKVLRLDKNNKTAREGRDMYRNLKRIQQNTN